LKSHQILCSNFDRVLL